MATASPKAEVQARIWPRHFIGGRTADTLTGDGKEEDLRLLEGLSGETAALPLECSARLVEGSPAWRHDLGRVAFATVPGTFSGQGDDAVRWTVWVADLEPIRKPFSWHGHPAREPLGGDGHASFRIGS